jgi:hypothetical protein
VPDLAGGELTDPGELRIGLPPGAGAGGARRRVLVIGAEFGHPEDQLGFLGGRPGPVPLDLLQPGSHLHIGRP